MSGKKRSHTLTLVPITPGLWGSELQPGSPMKIGWGLGWWRCALGEEAKAVKV
tara:strand:+ start:678 stop:836 length:159 start_codon:yes stop_codon:yes gene_type:complete